MDKMSKTQQRVEKLLSRSVLGERTDIAVNELCDEIEILRIALHEIINHEKIHGYTPTHKRCADLARKALGIKI